MNPCIDYCYLLHGKQYSCDCDSECEYAKAILENKALKETVAVAALHAQQDAEELWHDAKENPPKNPGLYYGKQDDTNCMWLCRYRDGVWTLDAYPEQKREIVKWAEYTSFNSDEESEANKNDPLTLDELQEMDGEPIWVEYIGINHSPEWFILCIDGQEAINRRGGFVSMLYYEKTWLAYRHKQ